MRKGRLPRRDPVNAAVAAVLAAAVALWVSGGGQATRPGTPADALISAGRLSGLLAAALLLVAVVLMARVPWVESALGHDELARRHRLVAMWSFGLLWLHVGVSVAGYARRARAGLPATAWDLAATFPGMLLAVAAAAALTLVAATSGRAARRRTRYESWHLLHLYAYLGAGLAVPHQIWAGGDLAGSPAAQAFWVGAWLAAASAVLAFRVLLPLWRSLRHRLRVLEVVPEAGGAVSVWLGGRDLARLNAAAGQYFVWRFRDGPGWTRGHPYSLSAAPGGGRVRITVGASGEGAGRLATLRPGTTALVEGPYGRLTPRHWSGGKVAMIGAGIGITPLLALLQDLPYADGDAVLVYRARSEADLVLRAELTDLEVLRGVSVHYMLGPRARHRRSWLPAGAPGDGPSGSLLRLVPDLPERDVFVCGPEPWADAVCAAALAAGVPSERLHRERFAW